MEALYLAGSHHYDFKGPDRLARLLNFVRPEAVGVESTEIQFATTIASHAAIVAESLEMGPHLVDLFGSETAIGMYQFFHTIGYENWIVEDYIRRNPGTELIFGDKDMGVLMDDLIMRLFGNLSTEEGMRAFIEKLSQINFAKQQREVEEVYQSIAAMDAHERPDFYRHFLVGRDRHTEYVIRHNLPRIRSKFVYVGGAAHFFGNYRNLYERLRDLQPIRILLPQIEDFA